MRAHLIAVFILCLIVVVVGAMVMLDLAQP